METNLLGWNSVQRSWFLRDNEAGLHSFVRLAYHNPSDTVGRGGLGEVRTMFRPSSGPWTTLVTNEEQWVHNSDHFRYDYTQA